jgi:DNA-binding SARP family transcriptional activator/DNA-binding CsgD family transcriptional regulator
MEFRILGPLELVAGDRVVALGGAKQRAVLAVLLLHLNEVVTRGRLIDAVWGERAPATAAKSVQVYVSGLRRALRSARADDADDGILLTRYGGYVLQLDPGRVDAYRFERLVQDAREDLDAGAAATAADTLRAALGLWRGAPLIDLAYEASAQAEIVRLEELRLAALETRIDADLDVGRHAALIGELEALVMSHPARERLAAQLMVALYRSGRQADALDVYRRARAHLDAQLGLEPGAELRALQLAVLNQSVPPAPAARAPAKAGVREDTAGGHDLPGPLCLTSALPFVGRVHELATLRSLIPWAEGEGLRVVLVGGEAGSGKSGLVREFAGEAAAKGALVLYGACDGMVRPPYGPFVEALDHLARVADSKELRAALGPTGGELVRLLPELPSRVGGLAAPVAGDPDTERHRLHTAVTDLLAGVSRQRPALLVLEDVHWSDPPTLVLLRRLARAGGRARLLVLATFRDTEREVPAALSEALADLRRSENAVRLPLTGLSREEIGEFVRLAAGGDGGAGGLELARTISDLTEGNPFLVCELWRALVDSNAVETVDGRIRLSPQLAELGSPESVREVVNQRLARLHPGTCDLLELAATAGSEIEFDVVRQAPGVAESAVSAALDEAVDSGLIQELPSRQLAYRFTHELFRRALYEGLSGLRRAELHLRVGEALERSGARSGRALADLAHHFAAAAQVGGTARGVQYNRLAARAASAALAFDEAAERLRVALGLGIPDAVERGQALLELGVARSRAGRENDALAPLAQAAETARELRDADMLARAAIEYETACVRPPIIDRDAVELLEEAAAALGDRRSLLQARVLGRLARALDKRGSTARGSVVRAKAVEMAREVGDPAALAFVLSNTYWARDIPRERVLEMVTEARSLAEQASDLELRAEAMNYRVATLVELCDIDSAGREAAAARANADQVGQPFHLHVAEHDGSAIALCQGRLAEAEAMAHRSHEYSRLLTGRDASGVYGIQMFGIRREQGRLAELVPAIRALAGESTRESSWRPGLVALLADLGMQAEARRELASVAAAGLDRFRASLWLASLTYLTDACAEVGDERMAALVYPELAARAGTNVVIGSVVACYGAADRYLGMLAATLGDWDPAEEHFARAMALNRRMGAHTWLAHTAYQHARMLTTRADRERATSLLGEAAALAERIGMSALVGRIRTLQRSGARPDTLSPRELRVLSLAATGLSNREIGTALRISEHTAANHIHSILRKTRCANRTEAAGYAHRHGLVETSSRE